MSYDFQKVVDGIKTISCVMSVEKLENGRRGNYRIVTGNKAYFDSIKNSLTGEEISNKEFIPNSIYTDYINRDLNFENYCWQSAIDKKCLHSYAKVSDSGVWVNMNFIPLEHEEKNFGYCLYTMEVHNQAQADNMTSSPENIDSKVLEICIKIRGSNNFHSAMEVVINDIRELCDAEHCCILTMDHVKRSCTVFCESLSYDTPLAPMGKYVDDAFYDIADSWKDTIGSSNCLIIKDEQEMEVLNERNPVWRESLRQGGARSIVMFPLIFKDDLLGYIWAINFNAENAIKIKESLELATFILGSEFSNYFLLDKLRVLSSKDLLTGVLNRNEMNNFVSDISMGQTDYKESAGVIFADLNGLKTVNDKSGHLAGDRYLKNAAAVLKEIFNENEVFRAGGDEFSVIKTGITEKDLEAKVQQVREVSKKYDEVSFALGYAWVDDCRDIRKALRQADERMYEDKNLYYQEHPQIQRRQEAASNF